MLCPWQPLGGIVCFLRVSFLGFRFFPHLFLLLSRLMTVLCLGRRILPRLVVAKGLEPPLQLLGVVKWLVLAALHNVFTQIIDEGQSDAIVRVRDLWSIAVDLVNVHCEEVARADIDADTVLREARVGPLVLVTAFNDDEVAETLVPIARVLVGGGAEIEIRRDR